MFFNLNNWNATRVVTSIMVLIKKQLRFKQTKKYIEIQFNKIIAVIVLLYGNKS